MVYKLAACLRSILTRRALPAASGFLKLFLCVCLYVCVHLRVARVCMYMYMSAPRLLIPSGMVWRDLDPTIAYTSSRAVIWQLAVGVIVNEAWLWIDMCR